MGELPYYDFPAALNFDRFDVAANWKKSVEAPKFRALCQGKQKPFLPRIPLTLPVKQRSDPRGFFTSIAVALRATPSIHHDGAEEKCTGSQYGKVQFLQSSGLAATTRPGTNGNQSVACGSASAG